MTNCQLCGATLEDFNGRCFHRCLQCGWPAYQLVTMAQNSTSFHDYVCARCGESWIYCYSHLSNFRNCPRYCFYCNELGRSLSSQPMMYGSAIHRGINTLMLTHDVEEAVRVFMTEYPPAPEWEGMRTQGRGELIIRLFWDKYKDEELFKDGESEISGAVEIAPGILYAGTIDWRAKVPGGETVIIDFKTTSYFNNPSFRETFQVSHQMTGYEIVAACLTDKPLKESYVVFIKVAKGTKARSKAELQAGRFPYDDAFEYAIEPQTRMQFQYNEFHDAVMMSVNWWNQCRHTGTFPQNDNYCYHYNSKCQYLDLCCMPFEKSIQVIQAAFPLRHWDPVAGRETLLKEVIGV